MKLTLEHSELLYQIADIHYDWIKKYNPDSDTSYSEILNLNHDKLLNHFFDLEHTEVDVTEKLLKMRANVLRMRDDF